MAIEVYSEQRERSRRQARRPIFIRLAKPDFEILESLCNEGRSYTSAISLLLHEWTWRQRAAKQEQGA